MDTTKLKQAAELAGAHNGADAVLLMESYITPSTTGAELVALMRQHKPNLLKPTADARNMSDAEWKETRRKRGF